MINNVNKIYNIPLPCDYAVMYTSYVDRILDDNRSDKLAQLAEHLSIEPLYLVSGHKGMGGNLHYLVGDEATQEESRQLYDSLCPIEQTGCVVFGVNTVGDGLDLVEVLKNLDYCQIYGIERVEYRVVVVDGINRKVMWVTTVSESG